MPPFRATASLLLLISAPPAAHAARVSVAANVASTGECGCRGSKRCSCAAYLAEESIDLKEKAEEICPKARETKEDKIRFASDVSQYFWGKQMPKGYFDTFKGMMNFGAEIENDKCLVPGSCFGEIYQACGAHYGCKLADAPERAWGLCEKVFVSKDWSMQSAALQLFKESEGTLWCSEKDIEGYCGKTEADIPEFPNACSRALSHLEGKEQELCSGAFQFETSKPAGSEALASAPTQFKAMAAKMAGYAKRIEHERGLPQGTCYPWIVHACTAHYQKNGCELKPELKSKVCERVFTSQQMTPAVAVVALFQEKGLWCTEEGLKADCDQA